MSAGKKTIRRSARLARTKRDLGATRGPTGPSLYVFKLAPLDADKWRVDLTTRTTDQHQDEAADSPQPDEAPTRRWGLVTTWATGVAFILLAAFTVYQATALSNLDDRLTQLQGEAADRVQSLVDQMDDQSASLRVLDERLTQNDTNIDQLDEKIDRVDLRTFEVRQQAQAIERRIERRVGLSDPS